MSQSLTFQIGEGVSIVVVPGLPVLRTYYAKRPVYDETLPSFDEKKGTRREGLNHCQRLKLPKERYRLVNPLAELV